MKGTFYWSVRRELWEHRSVWLAPLAVAAFVLVAFTYGLSRSAREIAATLSALPPGKQQHLVTMPFGLAASVILLTGFVVAAFYCVEALNTERRDRSILFWKSMPVSDLTTVLAKALVPVAVIPLVAYAIALATQAMVFTVSAVVLKALGADIGALWAKLPMTSMTLALAYGVAVHALWFAPLFALLLLASVAIRRPLPWVVVSVIALQLLEKIAFGTNYSGAFVKYRVMGAMTEAFRTDALREPVVQLSQLDPARFFTSPGLWLGLVAAAVFLSIAVRLRRLREPLS